MGLAEYGTFSEVRARLDEILVEVRKKDLSLEKSLDLYEEAIKLGNRCAELVDKPDFTAEEANAAMEAIGGATAGADGEGEDAGDAPEAAAGAAEGAGDAGAADADAGAIDAAADAPESGDAAGADASDDATGPDDSVEPEDE